MATMVVEVYDALRDAGASEEKSRAAATAVANYETRFNKVEADLLVVKWMLGMVVAGVASLVAKAFF